MPLQLARICIAILTALEGSKPLQSYAGAKGCRSPGHARSQGRSLRYTEMLTVSKRAVGLG